MDVKNRLMESLKGIYLSYEELEVINKISELELNEVEVICNIFEKCKNIGTDIIKTDGNNLEMQLNKIYPNGLPDALVVDRKRPLGKTSKKLWLDYLSEKGYTEESFKGLDGFTQYDLHCSYCNKYNIPHVED